MDNEITRIYQAINANSIRIEEINNRLDEIFGKRIDDITPYTLTKQAYIDDTEIIFTEIPSGNLSVYMQDREGNYPDFRVERSGDTVRVSFEPLEYVTKVTISVIGG